MPGAGTGREGTKCLQAQVATAHYPDALAQAQLVAQGEGIEIQPERGRALPPHYVEDLGPGIDLVDPRDGGLPGRLVHPVGLGEQDTVGEAELGRRHRMLVQLTADMFTVGQGDDGVQAQGIPQRLFNEEGLNDGGGIGEPRGLDDQPLELQLPRRPPGQQIPQGSAELPAHAAADAAVAELHHADPGASLQQGAVDIGGAKLVLENGHRGVAMVAQEVVEQGGLAGAEKTGQQSDSYSLCHVGVL